MNQSGNEFTLRVAICDLVERLKRMQHKCSYLEETRNHLVKEVIRLRLQNEWLARQINDSPEISSLPQNIPHCFCNQQNNLVNNTTYHTAHCHLNGQDHNNSSNDDSQGSNRSIDTKNSNKDESIHLINILNELDREEMENSSKHDSIRQLTIQLLKELDNELKTGQLKTELINFVKNNLTDEANDDELIKFDGNIDSDNRNDNDNEIASQTTNNNTNFSHDYEAFNNNSDYYTNSHNLNLPLEDLQIYSQQSTQLNKNSKQFSDKQQMKSTLQSKSKKLLMANDKTDINNSIKVQNSSTTIASTGSSTQSNQLFNSNSIGSIDEQKLLSIITSVNQDLKYLHQGVLEHTEKLNRLKTRQLRKFFQKQIDLDLQQQTNTSTGSILQK